MSVSLVTGVQTCALPIYLPVRGGLENRLAGRPLPRLDLPSKVDGSARFAGDVRLPDMVYASVRRGPYGGGPLLRIDRDAAEAVPGVIALFENPWWVRSEEHTSELQSLMRISYAVFC